MTAWAKHRHSLSNSWLMVRHLRAIRSLKQYNLVVLEICDIKCYELRAHHSQERKYSCNTEWNMWLVLCTFLEIRHICALSLWKCLSIGKPFLIEILKYGWAFWYILLYLGYISEETKSPKKDWAAEKYITRRWEAVSVHSFMTLMTFPRPKSLLKVTDIYRHKTC